MDPELASAECRLIDRIAAMEHRLIDRLDAMETKLLTAFDESARRISRIGGDKPVSNGSQS
jgi:hypothetical protein